ncbi:MAG: DUF485 domain-containing protein [Solirubrobacteraceae bacterium]
MNNNIQNTTDFKKFIKTRWLVSLLLTTLMLTFYFGFIITIAYFPNLLAIKVFNELNIGITSGIFLILFAWILTGVYIFWANNFYDKKATHFKKLIK